MTVLSLMTCVPYSFGEIMKDKPRVNFCWQCGKKLYGNHFEEIEVDGYTKTVHKICAKNMKDKYEICTASGEPEDDGWGRGL